MKPLEIKQFGNPLLRQQASDLKEKDLKSPSLVLLIKRMLITMEKEEGIGLAAPQIGKSLNLFIIHIHKTSKRPMAKDGEIAIVINPTIIKYGTEIQEDWEACLSLPGIYGLVPRSTDIQAQYIDRMGHKITKDLRGLEARVFQHEFDHLNGTLFVDRMKDMQSLVTEVGLADFVRNQKIKSKRNERR